MTTPTNTTESTNAQLPPELMVQITNILFDQKDFRTLSRMQRTSRDLYLIATPLMYLELGRDFKEIVDSLSPLLLLDPAGEYIPNEDEANGVDRHPIELSLLDRLHWQYSKVERLVYEPTTGSALYTVWERLESHLGRVLDAIKSQRPQFDPKTLFYNAKNMIINLDKLPLRRGMLEDFEDIGYESDDTRDQDFMDIDEWLQRHPPIETFLEFFIAYASATRICLNLEGHPIYGGGSYFNGDFGVILGKFESEYIIIHQLTMANLIQEFPIAENVVLDVHPHYTTIRSRMCVIGDSLRSYKYYRDDTAQRPRILVKKPIWGNKDESEFRKTMDRVVSIPKQYGSKEEGEAFKLKWDFLGGEGKVEECSLCRGEPYVWL